MPVQISLYLVPAFASNPLPFEVLTAIGEAKALLKNLLEASETRGASANFDRRTLSATVFDTFASLENAVKQLKRYRRENKATALEKKTIKKLAKMTKNLRKGMIEGEGVDPVLG